MAEAYTIDLPDEGGATTVTLGAAGVETIVPFPVDEGGSFFIDVNATMSRLRLIGIDGTTIASFADGSVPGQKKFTTTDALESLGLTSISPNARVTLWRLPNDPLIINAPTKDRYFSVDPIPGKGVTLNVTLAAANVPTVVPFRVDWPQRFVIVNSLALSDVSLIGLDGKTIVSFSLTNSFQRLPPFRSPEPIASISMTASSANTTVALWRYER